MARRLTAAHDVLRRLPGVDEFVLVGRHTGGLERHRGPVTGHRAVDDSSVTATLFRDLRRGRGQTSLSVTTDQPRAIEELATSAAARAGQAIGPPWRMPPPSAPARVDIADPDLAERPGQVLASLEAELERAAADAGVSIAALRLSATRTEVRAQTSNGFDNDYLATRIEAAMSLSLARAGETSTRVVLSARRPADLDPAARIAGVANFLARRAEASALEPGRYDLVLVDEALAARAPPAATEHGWLTPLVSQARAIALRRGLTRYRPGASVFGDTEPTGDPLTVVSDGTLPFGAHSRPFGDLAEPVRRFALIENGIAAGVGLPLREAALAGREPNGGVANLVVDPGPSSLDDLRSPDRRPVVEVLALDWLDLDPDAGLARAGIGLARLHRPGMAPMWVRGGAVHGDLFDWLARGRWSSESRTAGWYAGPRALRVDRVEIGP